MIRKRSVYWILSLVLAMPLLARATQFQGGGGRGGGGGPRGQMSPDDRLKQMTKEFNLTSDQQAKIQPILVDAQKKMEDLRKDSSGDRQAMRSKMMKIREDTNTQVRSLLDDKQKDMFDKREQEREQRGQNRRGGSGGSGSDDQGGPPQN